MTRPLPWLLAVLLAPAGCEPPAQKPPVQSPTYIVAPPVSASAGADASTPAVSVEPEGICSDPVVFDDLNLTTYVRSAIRKPDGPLHPTDLSALQQLFVGETGVSTLAGIQCLPGLTSLDVTWREYEEFSSHGQHIRHIFMRDCELDLTPLRSMVNLSVLRVVGAQLHDLSPLSGLTKLKILDLRRTSHTEAAFGASSHRHHTIHNLAALSELSNLVELRLRYGEVEDLSGLSGLARLEHLDLAHNKIQDILPLSKMLRLTKLDLEGNPVQSLKPLLDLRGLQTLRLGGHPFDCKAHIAEISSLRQRGVQVDGCP